MPAFDDVFARTLGLEGGFVDNPHDPGGATRWGITQRVARANGYAGDMADLDPERARAIAKASYWDVMRLDEVAERSARLAEELFDTGYNMGVRLPVRFLQRALNLLNRSHRDTPDYDALVEDGKMGPATLAALDAFLDLRREEGEQVLLKALDAQQAVRYMAICEERESSEEFLYGWLLKRIH